MKRRRMGELEGAVMDVLWTDGGWLTPAQVHESIAAAHPLAYTTVMTILVRLWQKNRVERRRVGRPYAYHALLSREEYTAQRMSELLDAATDRASALTHFVRVLEPKERARLRRILGRKGHS